MIEGYTSRSELPRAVQAMPIEAQDVFLFSYNSALAGMPKGTPDPDTAATKAAMAKVQLGLGEGGKWVAKIEKYNPNQPRDARGRWGGGGGDGAWPTKMVDRIEAAGDIAESLGFDRNNLFVDYKPFGFTLNGQDYTSGGHYNPADGKIGIAHNQMTQAGVEYILPHEIMHHKFHTVVSKYAEESATLRAQMAGAQSEANVPLAMDDSLKPEFRSTYPVYDRMHRLFGGEAVGELARTDGITEYSDAYWNAHQSGSTGNTVGTRLWENAVNETLAEMARLNYADPGYTDRFISRRQGTAWGDLYHGINDLYADMTRTQRETK